tara:strand:- start:488 stop:826 length:339 start_codon:yes stop_codon:yes gene_type:complete
MKNFVCKSLITVFLIAINLSFISLIHSSLEKDSLEYSYLCKFDSNSKDSKTLAKENCFYCILKNGVTNDCDDLFFSTILSPPIKEKPRLISYINFHFFKKNSQKTRAPPALS